LGENPHVVAIAHINSRIAGVEAQVLEIKPRFGPHKVVSPVFLSAFLEQTRSIRRERSEGKLLALCGATSSSPKGDVVAIGSFCDKSEYALNRLAASYGICNTVAFDPWNANEAVRVVSPQELQRASMDLGLRRRL
jgi:hypothetical protein